MKNIIILLALILPFSSLFAISKTQIPKLYDVESDVNDTSVPAGKCLITGVVTDQGNVVNEATIYSQNARPVNSDKLGRFKIIVDTADTYLIIDKEGIPSSYVERYKFENQHHVDVKIYMPKFEDTIMVDKPVIYAYGKENTTFEMTVSPKGNFTFTYPQINANNKWNAEIDANGLSVNGKLYPYLFYETAMTDLNFLTNEQEIKGSVIQKNEVVTFLETSLSSMNLNAQEKTDFITYWAPRMIAHEQVFVQFLIAEDYNQIANLEIVPKPDNVTRVFLLFSEVDTNNQIECAPQQFYAMDRTGFTIVEWGGSEIPKQKLYSKKTL